MNLRLLLSKMLLALRMEVEWFLTPTCNIVTGIKKWWCVISNKREITWGGRVFIYEDRISPLFFCSYQREISKLSKLLEAPVPPVRILDVGANIGIWGRALYQDALLDEDTEVYSFEPNPEPFKFLEMNSSYFDNWKVFNFGISESDAEYELFYIPGKSAQGSRWKENSNLDLLSKAEVKQTKVNVKEITPNFCVSELGGRYFDLIKIDVEGAESDVVTGLSELTWHFMYVEVSLRREGATTVEDMTNLVQSIWPSASLIHSDDHGIVAETYYQCK